MARTLGGEEADQVTKPGRRVLIGWTGPAPQETFNNALKVHSRCHEIYLLIQKHRK